MNDRTKDDADEVRQALRILAAGKVRPGARCVECDEWHTRLLQVDHRGEKVWAPYCSDECRDGGLVRGELIALKCRRCRKPTRGRDSYCSMECRRFTESDVVP